MSSVLIPSDVPSTVRHRPLNVLRGPVRLPLFQRVLRPETGRRLNSLSLYRLSKQRGQAMTEYLIIVALIAVAAIAVYQSFGQVIRSQTAGLAKELAGESASQAVSAAKSASNTAMKQKDLKTLKSYGSSGRGQ